nr:TetR/AcrR family transcriptional regulator C-terminal domain-containing protein [Nocardioides sp. MAH-18]
MLAAVADEVLRRGHRDPRPAAWDDRVVAIGAELRDAMLAYRDGAELVATVRSFGLGAATPYDELASALADGDLDAGLVPTATRTLLHYVFGHAVDEQTHLQAGSAGAIDDAPRAESDFHVGLAIVLDGIRALVRNREAH